FPCMRSPDNKALRHLAPLCVPRYGAHKRKHRMMRTLLVRPLRGALAVLVCIASLMLPLRTEALLFDAAAQLKIAPDLLATISGSTAPIVPWATLLNGELLVKVLVTANSDDESLTALRSFVLSLGGSVYYHY